MTNPRRPIGQPSTVRVQGFALRVIRKRTGITSAELAARIDCDPSYVRRIETGHAERVSEEFLGKIRKALDLMEEDRRALLADPLLEAAVA